MLCRYGQELRKDLVRIKALFKRSMVRKMVSDGVKRNVLRRINKQSTESVRRLITYQQKHCKNKMQLGLQSEIESW